jgi:hypothetical protein
MSAAWVSVISGLAGLITAAGAVVAVVLDRKRDRNKPALDSSNVDVAKATLQQMIEEGNYYRDVRIWQLEGYVDLDRVWHRQSIETTHRLIAIVRMLLALLKDAGVDTPDIEMPAEPPPPPEIPKPPSRRE